MVGSVKNIGRYAKKTALLLLGCLLLCTVAGCGSASGVPAQKQDSVGLNSMEDTPIVDYVVPTLTPNILVDQKGYPSGGEKRAAVKGTVVLPESFRLIDSRTKEVVYTGSIEDAAYDPEMKLYSGYIDFGEFDREGDYYLECDRIGRSYSFAIRDALYQELFWELYEETIAKCEDRTATIQDAMALLHVYEWQPQVCRDDDQNEIPDVMEVLAKWVSNVDYNRIDVSEGAVHAAFLAKFSYLYQKYDLDFATECLQRASTIFSQTQNTMQEDAYHFYALTELYRATGLAIYGNQILDYKAYFEKNSNFLEETGYLYGAMTYMATRQKVDVELCALFMDRLLERGEEIDERSEDMLCPVSARNNGAQELLKRSEELVCANYVLGSYQNDCILEEFLHYLMGCNIRSVCFYPEEGDPNSYLLLLAQLAGVHKEQNIIP